MTRIACAWVPLFPLAARLRSEPELFGEALAVFVGSGTKARVHAATRAARRAGVRAGMTLAQARSLMPKLIARARDPECEGAANESLLEVAESVSPRVEDSGGGFVYLDLDGLQEHYDPGDPELDLARTLMRRLDREGLPARVGIAANKLAARTAALQPHGPHVVAAGDEAVFLAPLPLERLAPEIAVAETLERWGLRTVGDLARLPANEVRSRLGDEGWRLHRSARGLDASPLVPRQPPPDFREGMTLEWPLVSLEPFLFIARAALERLCRRLDTQGLGCSRLEVSMRLDPDGHHDRSLCLPSPTRDLKTLLELVRLDLEVSPPGAPVVGFSFAAEPDRPRAAQLSIFGPAVLSPERLATTLAKLFVLLGPGRVGAPACADGHLPERFEIRDFAPPPEPKMRLPVSPTRGLLAVRVVRPPLALEVETAPDDSRPVRYVAREAGKLGGKNGGVIRVASGPWQIEERWWDDDGSERQYWDIESERGDLFRIFRETTDGRWFLDGIYD